MARATIGMLALVTLACMLLAAPHAEAAVSCGSVSTSLAPCIPYLRSGGAVPPTCCKAVNSLHNAGKTTADRQAACNCLKVAYNSISGIQAGFAAGLPGKCGVNIPYKMSPSTDCSKVK